MFESDATSEDKASICGKLTLLAPPLQFTEVLNDVRAIAGDDPAIQKKLASVTSQYDRDQMIPVKLPNSERNSLLTLYGDKGKGYFYCPRYNLSFHYDHMNQTVSDVKDAGDRSPLEKWRLAWEEELTKYCDEHFLTGSVSVYAQNNEDCRLAACISSQYGKHLSTGRWRSEWVITMPNGVGTGPFKVHGSLKVQTHIYEDGNVQLISSKNVDFSAEAPNPSEFTVDCVRQIKDAECAYQLAVGENLKTMSGTTFKALRRPLPLTHSKIDWNKMITYKIGSELSRATS